MDSQLLKEELLKIEKKLSKEPTLKNRVQELRNKATKSDKVGLEFELRQLASHAQAIESQKKSDETLKTRKEEVKELNASYNEQLKYNKLQARLVGLLLQELNNFEK